MPGPVGDIFGGNTDPFYNYQGNGGVDLGMFGYATPEQIAHPYTPPGTTSPTVNPEHPWWEPGGSDPRGHSAGSPGATPTTPPPTTKTANPNAADPGSARSLLRQYGLDELAPMVDGWIGDGLSLDQIGALLYDRSSAPGKVVDRLFPELRMRQEAGKSAISIGSVIDYRTNARAAMRAAGAPAGLWDTNEDFQNLILNDVSPSELQDRLNEYADFGTQLAADPAHASELEGLQRYYGVQLTPFDVASLALNPNEALPALKRKFNAVRNNSAGIQSGFGQLSQGEAERLADVGVSATAATQGFGSLVKGQELFNSLPGENTDSISRADQLTATFEGNAAAQKRIARRQQQRVAAFDGGGGFTAQRPTPGSYYAGRGAEGIGTAVA